MDQKLSNSFYQKTVVKHSQRPQNFLKLKKYTHSAVGYNPVCGDEITVYVYAQDEQFRGLSFTGDCCAVCKSSASLMTGRLMNAGIQEFQNIFEEFIRLINKTLDPDREQNCLGEITVFKGIWDYPGRIKCANLGWYTLKAALNNQSTVSTE
ncbi:MAG: Fe-S cluster assembly sulfur transfer protein SufU [Candidatus Omnitrophota bacterium]